MELRRWNCGKDNCNRKPERWRRKEHVDRESRRGAGEGFGGKLDSIGTEIDELNELERALERIEREHYSESIVNQAKNETDLPSFRSIESFLYRVSKVFADKRPIDDQGRAMDKKAYVRQVERKQEMGLR